MKLTSSVIGAILLSAQLLIAGPGNGQPVPPGKAGAEDKKITLGASNEKLSNVLKKIQKLSGYRIAYPSSEVAGYTNVNFAEETRSVGETLTLVLRPTIFDFAYKDNTIILFNRQQNPQPDKIESPANATARPADDIRGRIIDDRSGEPVSEASVIVKGTKTGATSDRTGLFIINGVGAENVVLIITHIGYEPKEISVSANNTRDLVINLTLSAQSLRNVEISTGQSIRRLETVAGSASTFTGRQLQNVNTTNLVQALKVLDVSFQVIDNNNAGSDPNTLPDIELRGKTAIPTDQLNSRYSQNPNLPLFILDGFQTDLQTIIRLDMSRIASVSILKDAASAAIWGSLSANGVVVVETKKPVPGRLNISYTGTVNMDAVDLDSYNLMDASQKLEFERLAGLYNGGARFNPDGSIANPGNASTYIAAQKKYNDKLAEIKRGVNSYWLSDPVQNGIGTNHSITFSGGGPEFQFTAGGNYNLRNGAMKGSDSKAWGGYTTLTYRKGKFNITNQLTVIGGKANGSPYGDFSQYARANPYYRKRDSTGAISKYLNTDQPVVYMGDDIFTSNTINPLYNAQFAGINRDESLQVYDNIGAAFRLTRELNLTGGIQIRTVGNTHTLFVRPETTAFDGVSAFQRGTYTSTRNEQNSVSGNLGANYTKSLGKNLITLTGRVEATQVKINQTGFSVVGFRDGASASANNGYQANPNIQPATLNRSPQDRRSAAGTASLGYIYDNRYVINTTYSVNGDNYFGPNKSYDTWSVGAQWNLHREHFLENAAWLDLLSVYANFGRANTQQTAGFVDGATYSAAGGGSSIFGQVLDLSDLGNAGLRTPITKSISAGTNFSFLDSRFNGSIGYYEKNTTPNIIPAIGTLPGSVGLPSSYPLNVGTLIAKGIEVTMAYSPVYNRRKNIIWTVGFMATNPRSTYRDLGTSLEGFNKEAISNNSLNRYVDGYGPTDLWAVVSKGIDPATGQEIFLKKDGTFSFAYDPTDAVRIGDSRPKVAGNIRTSFQYKGFSLSAYIQYSIRGYRFNYAVYNTVENINSQSVKDNQDARALTDRWKNPGDISQFKSIKINTTNPASSRFIEEDNFFNGQSITLGWNAQGRSWLNRYGLKNLTAFFTANDLFRLESIKSERGISYPFARTMSFTLTTNF